MRDIWLIATKSYRDSFAMLQRMTMPLVIGVVIIVLVNGVGYFVEQRFATTIGRILVSTLAGIAGTWAAAPYLLALYRFVLLDEINSQPEALRNTDAANRLFGWTAVASFLWTVPLLTMALLTPPGMTLEEALSPRNSGAVWIVFGLLIAFWVFTTRMMTLLPGAALGEETSIARAFAQTRGRFWFIVGTLFVAILPFSLASTLIRTATTGVLDLAVSILSLIFALVIGIALTANLYRWLVDHPK